MEKLAVKQTESTLVESMTNVKHTHTHSCSLTHTHSHIQTQLVVAVSKHHMQEKAR